MSEQGVKEQLQEILGVHVFSVQMVQLKVQMYVLHNMLTGVTGCVQDSDSLFAASYDVSVKNLQEYSRCEGFSEDCSGTDEKDCTDYICMFTRQCCFIYLEQMESNRLPLPANKPFHCVPHCSAGSSVHPSTITFYRPAEKHRSKGTAKEFIEWAAEK